MEQLCAEESKQRDQVVRLEKEVALVRHEHKEVQKKFDLEAEARSKAEVRGRELEVQLQLEVQQKQKESERASQSAEKIASLEKQVSGRWWC